MAEEPEQPAPPQADAGAERPDGDLDGAHVDGSEPEAIRPADVPGRAARLRALARRHPLVAALTAALAAVLLLGSGAVALGASTARTEPVAAPVVTVTPTPTPTETARPQPEAAPGAAKIRTCSVAEQASDPRLANLQARVVNAATGAVLYDRGGTTPSRTASVMKVLTAAAALHVFGPDHRVATTVVKGAEPGTAVLVGGGDVTLSRTPSGTETVYPGAAHLDDLAAQVRAAWDADPANPPLTRLVLDASLFGGEEWHPTWNPLERELGYMSHITALMVDGDRDDPSANTSVRSTDPIGRAGEAFAAELGGIEVIERGTAPAGAPVLGQVFSPTVAALVDKSLIVSDNTVAEMLARLVAVQSGAGNTFAAIDPAVRAALAAYGVDTTGVRVVDGSGLSDDNAVPPAYLTEFLRKVDAREGHLGFVLDSLPISGGPRGSLSYSDRFTGDNAAADGAVFAKTGWIETGYTLAGIVRAQDGATLTFAIYALGDVTESTKQAIDTLTTAFYRCGDGLSNG